MQTSKSILTSFFNMQNTLDMDRDKLFENSNIYFNMASKPINILYTGLEPVLSNTEKSYTASYHRQFSKNIKTKFIL